VWKIVNLKMLILTKPAKEWCPELVYRQNGSYSRVTPDLARLLITAGSGGGRATFSMLSMARLSSRTVLLKGCGNHEYLPVHRPIENMPT
jgi:hypothetical protein